MLIRTATPLEAAAAIHLMTRLAPVSPADKTPQELQSGNSKLACTSAGSCNYDEGEATLLARQSVRDSA